MNSNETSHRGVNGNESARRDAAVNGNGLPSSQSACRDAAVNRNVLKFAAVDLLFIEL